ncbi:MAG: DUF6465 family protein [Eubacteriales bacterium]|nr:DUF6465 family protein [Eubacteriales bacterium]
MATKRTVKRAETMAAKGAEKEAAVKAAEPAAKETTVKAEPAKAEAVKEPAAPKRTAARKPAVSVEPAKTAVYLQFMGKEVPIKEIVANVKKVWTDEMGKKESEIDDLKVYLKPEENKAYYVINDDAAGSVEL